MDEKPLQLLADARPPVPATPGQLARHRHERQLRLRRRLARSERGSNRRAALTLDLARLAAREGDRRKDWVEKTSTDLARRFDTFGIEHLKVAAMTRSAKGTAAAPGRNVAQKAGLNRGTLTSGSSQLATRLDHKAPGRIVKVNPAFTSQTCHVCTHIAKDSRESQAHCRCVACGHQRNADVNAARTIAERHGAAGHAVAARADMAAVGRSVKREPHLVTTSR